MAIDTNEILSDLRTRRAGDLAFQAFNSALELSVSYTYLQRLLNSQESPLYASSIVVTAAAIGLLGALNLAAVATHSYEDDSDPTRKRSTNSFLVISGVVAMAVGIVETAYAYATDKNALRITTGLALSLWGTTSIIFGLVSKFHQGAQREALASIPQNDEE